MNTPFTGGTVIHGTLRTQDLIPAFAAELKKLDTVPKFAMLIAEAEAIDFELNYNGEAAEDILAGLDVALNELAPDGWYFGAHPADGSDFGYWEFEE